MYLTRGEESQPPSKGDVRRKLTRLEHATVLNEDFAIENVSLFSFPTSNSEMNVLVV